MRISFGSFDIRQRLLKRIVEVFFGFFSFNGIIQNRSDVIFSKHVDSGLAVADRFSSAKMFEDGFPDQTLDRKMQGKCCVYKRWRYFYKPVKADDLKKPIGAV